MTDSLVFSFTSDLSGIHIPSELNNPFSLEIPEIARIATEEFQAFIVSESRKWEHDFQTQKGKMFGTLVVRKQGGGYGYLGTVSGKLPSNAECDRLVPSVFDESLSDSFLTKGMKELSQIGLQIKGSDDAPEISSLREMGKQKSIALQQRLFEHYHFLNLSGKKKNLLEIFERSSQGKPPSAAGECAAPKLLQYAIQHNLEPIAWAEFWWGTANITKDREHKVCYPACTNKCRPILEYMLEDEGLFEKRNVI